MTIPTELQQQIVAFLQDLPNLHGTAVRQAFITAAGLDPTLEGANRAAILEQLTRLHPVAQQPCPQNSEVR